MLVLPEGARIVDPMRSADAHDPCASCGARDWADLGEPSTVLALRHVDELEAVMRASKIERVLRRAWASSRALGAAILVGLVFAFASTEALASSVFLLPGLVGLVVLGVALVFGAVQDIRSMRAPATAARWSLPLPRHALAHAHPVHGIVRAHGPLLRAPLSGTPCVAYELAIRIDTDRLAPDPTWLLLEHHNAQLVIDGTRVEPDSVRLDLPRSRIPVDAEDDPTVGAALSRRGFFAHDTRVVVYEAVLLPGVAVELAPVDAQLGRRVGKVLRLSLSPMQPLGAERASERSGEHGEPGRSRALLG
jgi:hypothetical protein